MFYTILLYIYHTYYSILYHVILHDMVFRLYYIILNLQK